MNSATNMLYIQENNSLNTARVFRVTTLHDALETMMKLYVEIKFTMEDQVAVLFDLQEALEYFEQTYELRYFEELNTEAIDSKLSNLQVVSMKILDKANLLDEFVDFFAENPNEMKNQDMQ